MKLKPSYIRLTREERLYRQELPLVGLSGGIACGKSSVAAALKERGLAVICADMLVKELYRAEETAAFALKLVPECKGDDGRPDFAALRSAVFRDASLLQKLEDFIHPRLGALFCAEVERLQDVSVLVYDVPLLFEKSLDGAVDLSVCVHCPRGEQIGRLIQRDGISRELVESMLERQLPIAVKKERADALIDNGGSPRDLTSAVDTFLERYFI